MHAVFEGVTRDLLNRFQNEELKRNDQKNAFDKRILRIRVPAEVARTTRTLSDFKSGKWRVSEIHTFLFLAPVLLHGLIPDNKFDLVLFLCVSIYNLHSEVVSTHLLRQSEQLINRFGIILKTIYGKAACTYNAHLLRHLCKKVADCGPLHTHSCDPFERQFATMLKVKHGSRGAANQILRYLNSRTFVQSHWDSADVRNEICCVLHVTAC